MAAVKHIIVLMLYGGNDNISTLTPYDLPTWTSVEALRPTFMASRASLAATLLAPITPLAGGKQYALAANLAPLKTLFDAGKLAVVLNVGNLIAPITKAQYLDGSVLKPVQLMSHNDQAGQIQSLLFFSQVSGWGGRFADTLSPANANPELTSINITNNDIFNTGAVVPQYSIAFSGGPTALFSNATLMEGSALAMTRLRDFMSRTRTSLISKSITKITKRGFDYYTVVNNAIAGAPAITTNFAPANDYIHNQPAGQLRRALELILQKTALGTAANMIIYCAQGGYDHHSGQLTGLPANHTRLGEDIKSFYDGLVEFGIQDDVVLMTISDFGRSITENGPGTDHGWGSVSFVVGGQVRGGEFYGTNPVLANGGVDDIGQGRLIPTTSYDQVAATVGKAMGLTPAQLATIFPNLVNFAVKDLGLLTPVATFNPLSLFTGGFNGGFYDPSDLSSMWQNAAGTTPAVVNSQVARINDKSGNGNHLTGNSGFSPILRSAGGFYWLEFNGVDQRLEVAMATAVTTTSLSVWAMERTLTDLNARIWSMSGPALNDFDSVTRAIALETKVGGILSGYRVSQLGTATAAINADVMVQSRFNNTDHLIRVNKVNNTAVASTGAFNFNGVGLGFRYGSSAFYSGRVYGGGYINRVLTAPEQLSLDTWTGAKAGLVL